MEDEGKVLKIEEEEEAMEDEVKDPKIEEEVEPVLRNPKHHLFVEKKNICHFSLKSQTFLTSLPLFNHLNSAGYTWWPGWMYLIM